MISQTEIRLVIRMFCSSCQEIRVAHVWGLRGDRMRSLRGEGNQGLLARLTAVCSEGRPGPVPAAQAVSDAAPSWTSQGTPAKSLWSLCTRRGRGEGGGEEFCSGGLCLPGAASGGGKVHPRSHGSS